MIGCDRRSLASVYEDARTVGLVLIGAGTLGAGGLGDLALSSVAIAVLGMLLWLLSYFRPVAIKEEK